jgi:hypothetical protein
MSRRTRNARLGDPQRGRGGGEAVRMELDVVLLVVRSSCWCGGRGGSSRGGRGGESWVVAGFFGDGTHSYDDDQCHLVEPNWFVIVCVDWGAPSSSCSTSGSGWLGAVDPLFLLAGAHRRTA